ncbi:hypothetical protein Patl1_04902 [Pistacia atlantica]|uniref:Uncharacterized protein n=1 Tax=Pistacia atlantica TaxID=434234 RepID=A0ACC1BPL5_9ROSI|nr:hypothetical protein Patl1_04902 [Pistacia atlantica]
MSFASLNVSNFVILRLRPKNYPLWREQVLALAETYKHWKIVDRLLRGWIIGTFVEKALSHVIGLDTSAQVWAPLKEAYAQSSQERQFQLIQQLKYMKKTQEDLVHAMNPSLHQCLSHQCHPIMRFMARKDTLLSVVGIGNGTFLKVTHTGDALLGSRQSAIVLKNVILVPELEMSLLSIRQLTSDYSITCEFSNSDFVIKDKLTQ